MANAAEALVANDAEPLPGPATSWAPGEGAPTPIPASGVPATGVNLDDLVKGPPKALQDGMVDIARRKGAADEKIYQTMAYQTDEDQKRLREAYNRTGIKADEFQKWNADEEAAKRRTDPIEAFASFGSVFGILASAFTHAPMENALNASAAAMGAIKAGDEKAYDRAHKAWEENTKMALDRHQLEHQAFQDASTLMKTNMEAGLNMAKINALRFDNKKETFLLENGMIKEWFEYQAAKQKTGLAIAEQLPKIAMENAKLSRLFALGYDPKNPTTPESQKALQQFQKEAAELKRSEHSYSSNPATLAFQKYMAEHPNATAEEAAAFLSSTKASGGAKDLTTDRQRAQDVASFRKELQAAKNDDGTPRYTAAEIAHKAAEFDRTLKTEAAAITGNQKDQLTGKMDRVDYMSGTIDKVEALLKKHKAITGLGGTITRPAEVVSNIFGGNETDRKQFERYILELQEWAPQALNDRNGRPLSSEAGKINGIIAGLRPGDTTANTARAYAELRPLLKKIKGNLESRRGGAKSDEPAASEKSDKPWLNDPVAQ